MSRWKREFKLWAKTYPVAYMPKKWQDWNAAKAMTQVANFVRRWQ